MFFWKIQRKTPVLESFFKKRPWHSCFPMNFANSLRTPFLTEHRRWLLLYVAFCMRTCSARTLALKAIRKINSRMTLFCKKTSQQIFTSLKSTTERVEKVWNTFKPNKSNSRTTSIVSFEHLSLLFLLFPFLTLNR